MNAKVTGFALGCTAGAECQRDRLSVFSPSSYSSGDTSCGGRSGRCVSHGDSQPDASPDRDLDAKTNGSPAVDIDLHSCAHGHRDACSNEHALFDAYRYSNADGHQHACSHILSNCSSYGDFTAGQ